MRPALGKILGLPLAVCLFAALLGPTASASTVKIESPLVPLAATVVRTPASPGTVSQTSGGATVDASNASDGYITAKYTGGSSKVKLQITRAGGTTYTYDLRGGQFETFPLTAGNGAYNIGVFENIAGDQYVQILSVQVNVTLKNALSPFLYPSQYVNFHAGSNAVAKGAELAKGKSSDLDVVASVYNYVINNVTYDTQKAATVQSGYLPNVDNVLSTGKGICFDYAALMTAMLRSQDIPTRLEVGYVSGGIYHAWISTYIPEIGWVNNIIYFDGQNWKLMDPTFASNGGESSSIMEFIGNGTNYATVYIY